MATTPRVRSITGRPKRTAEEKSYIAAVLTGLYASSGQAILHAENGEYTVAQDNVRKVALDQAAAMVRGKRGTA